MSIDGIEGAAHGANVVTPGNQILYVIGNGFDQYHGIASSYKEFGEYLQVVDEATYREFERYLPVDDNFWWKFESQLANLDTDSLVDDASQFLASYGDDDWSDASHYDYQYEIEKVVQAISKTLRQRFGEWVRQLDIPSSSTLTSLLLPLRRDARYLNFNYTDTLQSVYGIPDESILHIHGNARHADEKLILGHGRQFDAFRSAGQMDFPRDPSEEDPRILEGHSIIDDYFTATFKHTEKVIRVNQAFFQSLTNIRKVVVMGHSLSPVDMPYMREIQTHLGSSLVEWRVSFHESSTEAQQTMLELGVSEENVRYAPLSNLSNWRIA